MAISLYDLSVANYLQTLSGVLGFLDEGLTHFQANKVDLNEIVETRLFPDMLPLRFQLQSVAHHSLGAIEGMKKGLFQPPQSIPELDYAALQKLVADARDALQRVTPAEVNACEGKDVTFDMGKLKLPFTAELFMGTPGLGQSLNYVETFGLNDQIYALALATGFLGVAIHFAVTGVEKYVLRWHPSQRKGTQ